MVIMDGIPADPAIGSPSPLKGLVRGFGEPFGIGGKGASGVGL